MFCMIRLEGFTAMHVKIMVHCYNTMHLSGAVRRLLSCLRFGRFQVQQSSWFPRTLLGNCTLLPEIMSQPLPHYLKCILHC